MKTQKYIQYVLILIVVLGLVNCESLDYDETSFNRKDDVFTNFARSKNFLTGIYGYLPTDFNTAGGAMRAAASDEAEHSSDLSDIQKMNEGTWSAIQQVDNVWPTMYTAIRAANVFLKESEGQKFEEEQYNENYKEVITQYKNFPFEARFLRAFYYFELVKRYKDIPLITTVLTPDEAVAVKTTSYKDIIKFIADECTAIAPVLPVDYNDIPLNPAKETGRATRGAALALKARALLYLASPLYSDDNNALWQEAATAAKEVMDLNKYALTQSYTNVVNNIPSVPSSELIFERREAASNSFELRNFPLGYGGNGQATCPTQNLVDAYDMRFSGLPITAPGSGYNPARPYDSRDQRLEQTIWRNGATWKKVPIETFLGGVNGQPQLNATPTGYYLRKYTVETINPDIDLGPTSTREKSWTLFRYGEVFLNFAEAMNEAYGPDVAHPGKGGISALAAVNEIRRRASMPILPTGMTKDAFRTRLRNERRVELAFEDHRFWDIRRWKIGKETETINKIEAVRNPARPTQFLYTVKFLETRPFNERMNWYPIPITELFKNSNLKQNAGW